MLEYVAVGLLMFLSLCRDCIGEGINSSGSGVSENQTAETESASVWIRPVIISSSSAGIGLFIVLVVIAVATVCKYAYKRRHMSNPTTAKARATTRQKSKKASQNGSTSVINRAHNYEAVLPNFSTTPKEWKAQNYEVPLAQSGTLQRNTPTNSDIQRSLTMKETHSVEKTTSSSLDGPIYMNYQHADTCTQSRSLVDRPYMDSLKESLENLSYVGYKIRKMDTSDESCEV